MEIKTENQTSLVEAGQNLLNHSKAADFTAKRGAVVELFPFIFGAAERMSARAISRYLAKEENVKLSSVTITKALNDRKKTWLLYFQGIEPSARVLEKTHRIPMKDFLFREKFLFEPFKSKGINAVARKVIGAELAEANNVLRTKWYSIPWEVRLKAQPYLEGRLI